MRIEDRVLQEDALALERLGQGPGAFGQIVQLEVDGPARGKDRDDGLQLLAGGGLVERDAQGLLVDAAEVHPGRLGRRHQVLELLLARLDAQGVEELLVLGLESEQRQRAGEQRGVEVHVLGDGAQAFGPVIDGIHSRHDREQRLGGADVAGRLLAADVLLARLQRHAQRGVALGILRDADDAPGQMAHIFISNGEIGRVGAAETERNPEALRRAHRHVGAQLARRQEQRERKHVGSHDHPDRGSVGPLDKAPRVDQGAVRGGILQERAEDRGGAEVERRGVAGVHRDAQRLGPGANDREGLRVAVARDEERLRRLGPGDGMQERHRFGRRGALVEQRGVRDRQSGQIDDHGLVVEQRLEPPLRDLGLIGRVLRIPAGVLEDVALDDRRRDGIGITHSNE